MAFLDGFSPWICHILYFNVPTIFWKRGDIIQGRHYLRKYFFFFPDLSFRLSGNKSNNLKYLSFRKSWNNSNNLKSKIGPGILPKRGSKYTFFTMIMSKTFYIPYDLPSSVHFQMGIRAPKRHLFDRQFCVGLLLQKWAKRTGQNFQILAHVITP